MCWLWRGSLRFVNGVHLTFNSRSLDRFRSSCASWNNISKIYEFVMRFLLFYSTLYQSHLLLYLMIVDCLVCVLGHIKQFTIFFWLVIWVQFILIVRGPMSLNDLNLASLRKITVYYKWDRVKKICWYIILGRMRTTFYQLSFFRRKNTLCGFPYINRAVRLNPTRASLLFVCSTLKCDRLNIEFVIISLICERMGDRFEALLKERLTQK